MKIKHNFPYDVDDINAYDVAEMVANSDVKEQADFFEHLACQLTSSSTESNTKLSRAVEEIFMNNEEDNTRQFLEQMLGWFDYYEKEFNE